MCCIGVAQPVKTPCTRETLLRGFLIAQALLALIDQDAHHFSAPKINKKTPSTNLLKGFKYLVEYVLLYSWSTSWFRHHWRSSACIRSIYVSFDTNNFSRSIYCVRSNSNRFVDRTNTISIIFYFNN